MPRRCCPAIGRDATARVRRAIRPLGLGAQQFVVLTQLHALGETSQVELADALGIDRSNLAAIASDLADRGLLERARDSTTAAATCCAQRAGEDLLRRTEGAIAAADDELLAPLDAGQREQLYALLRRLADGVDLCPAPEAD